MGEGISSEGHRQLVPDECDDTFTHTIYSTPWNTTKEAVVFEISKTINIIHYIFEILSKFSQKFFSNRKFFSQVAEICSYFSQIFIRFYKTKFKKLKKVFNLVQV